MTTKQASKLTAVDGVWHQSNVYRGPLVAAPIKMPGQQLKGRLLHVKLLWCLVGLLAYVLLAMGWLIGAIGDCLWTVGKQLHDDKWRID